MTLPHVIEAVAVLGGWGRRGAKEVGGWKVEGDGRVGGGRGDAEGGKR